MAGARYDGLADWYDDRLTGFTGGAAEVLLELLGDGPGRCLDLGCGGGVHLSALAARGWDLVGTDLSADQLRVARARAPDTPLVRADAAALPFREGSFDAVVMAFVHTDLDDLAAALAEAARALRSGGLLVHLGTHPCFVGPFSCCPGEARPLLLPGYRDTRWTDDAPGFGDGLRRRVGVRHVPLALLLNALAGAGLALECAAEPGVEDYPRVLALAARRADRLSERCAGPPAPPAAGRSRPLSGR
jgi:SAM-dependent methyltransferase